MRLRPVLSLVVLMFGVLISGPAWAAPPQAPHSPRADRTLLQEILSEPQRAGDVKFGNDTDDQRVPGEVLSRPEVKAGGPVPSWCTNQTNNYCTYTWDWMNRCCNPSYIAPNAYCPSICE
jgi:hypothetical protein